MNKKILLDKKEIARIRAKEYYLKNKENILEKKKKYREENPDKIKEIKKNEYNKNKIKYQKRKNEWYNKNKEEVLEQNKIYRKENSEKVKKYKKEYSSKNRELINQKKRQIRNENSLVRLIDNIRRILRYGFISNNLIKTSKSEIILGCSFEDLQKHIESKFESWMNWDNYGNPKDGIIQPNKTWDIDHIIPISSAVTEEDVIKLNHYTNLQPLCSYENRFIKRNKINNIFLKDLNHG